MLSTLFVLVLIALLMPIVGFVGYVFLFAYLGSANENEDSRISDFDRSTPLSPNQAFRTTTVNASLARNLGANDLSL